MRKSTVMAVVVGMAFAGCAGTTGISNAPPEELTEQHHRRDRRRRRPGDRGAVRAQAGREHGLPVHGDADHADRAHHRRALREAERGGRRHGVPGDLQPHAVRLAREHAAPRRRDALRPGVQRDQPDQRARRRRGDPRRADHRHHAHPVAPHPAPRVVAGRRAPRRLRPQRRVQPDGRGHQAPGHRQDRQRHRHDPPARELRRHELQRRTRAALRSSPSRPGAARRRHLVRPHLLHRPGLVHQRRHVHWLRRESIGWGRRRLQRQLLRQAVRQRRLRRELPAPAATARPARTTSAFPSAAAAAPARRPSRTTSYTAGKRGLPEPHDRRRPQEHQRRRLLRLQGDAEELQVPDYHRRHRSQPGQGLPEEVEIGVEEAPQRSGPRCRRAGPPRLHAPDDDRRRLLPQGLGLRLPASPRRASTSVPGQAVDHE